MLSAQKGSNKQSKEKREANLSIVESDKAQGVDLYHNDNQEAQSQPKISLEEIEKILKKDDISNEEQNSLEYAVSSYIKEFETESRFEKFKEDLQKDLETVKGFLESLDLNHIDTVVKKYKTDLDDSSKKDLNDIKDKLENLKGYDLALMSELQLKQKLVKGKLYIKFEDGIIKYTVLDDSNIERSGEIKTIDMPIGVAFPTSDDLSQFSQIKEEILKVTSNRGHTHLKDKIKFKQKEKTNDKGEKIGNELEPEIKVKFPLPMRMLNVVISYFNKFSENKNSSFSSPPCKEDLSKALGINLDDLKYFFADQKFPEVNNIVIPIDLPTIKEAISKVPKDEQQNIEDGIKSIDELLEEMEIDEELPLHLNQEDKIESRLEKFHTCKLDKNEDEIFQWAKDIKGKLGESLDEISEAITHMDRAYNLLTGHNFRYTQNLACLLFLNNQERGVLSQISTGEGKTTIVSMLAVIKVLQGHKVDVITSNGVLAKDGAEEKATFYGLFDISVSHNIEENNDYVHGAKKCYSADIVYGDIGSFQFDYLRDSFEGLKTLGERKFDECWGILDEVDNMLVDNGGHIAKLAQPFQGFERLRYVYIKIWQQLKKAKVEVAEEIAVSLKQAQGLPEEEYNQKIKELMKKSEIDCIRDKMLNFFKGKKLLELHDGKPEYLEEYAQRTLSKWIENALMVEYIYQENYQYKVVHDKRTGAPKITPIDNYNTGVTLTNTILSYGVHQFLQLKHNLHLSYESLTSCYVSNVGYINLYGKKILGLTGTLGSVAERSLLSMIYDVDYNKIPTYKAKQFEPEKDYVVYDNDFMDFIAHEVLLKTIKDKRAVLIICATIHDANNLRELLKECISQGNFQDQIKIIPYRDESDQKNIEGIEVNIGNIIISTNIGGRGTDLKTSPKLEANGGLHVIVGFLPLNKRVEEQAFGRTARQGNDGTAQLVIRESEVENINQQLIISQNEFKILPCSSSTTRAKLPEELLTLTEVEDSCYIKKIKEIRDELECYRLYKVSLIKLNELSFEDEIFKSFSNIYNLLQKSNYSADNYGLTYILSDLKEYWAYWLEKNKCNENELQLLEYDKDKIAEKVKNQFSKFLLDNYKNQYQEYNALTIISEFLKGIEKGEEKSELHQKLEDELKKIDPNFEEIELSGCEGATVIHNQYYAIQQANYYINNDQSILAKTTLKKALNKGADEYSAGLKFFESNIKAINVYNKRFWDAIKSLLFLETKSESVDANFLECLDNAQKYLDKEKIYLENMLNFDNGSNDFSLILIENHEVMDVHIPQESNEITEESWGYNNDQVDASRENDVALFNDKLPDEFANFKVSEEQMMNVSDYTVDKQKKEQNYLLAQLKSRLCCLSIYQNNMEELKKEVQEFINKSANNANEIAIEVKGNGFLANIKATPNDENNEITDLIMHDDINEFGYLSYDVIYKTKVVHALDERVRNAAIAQISAGIVAIGIGCFFPMIMPLMGPLAGTLIGEGILDIIMDLMKSGNTEHDQAAYNKSKAITYGISAATMGIGALAMSTRILKSCIKVCESIAKGLKWLGEKIPFLKGVFDKAASQFIKLAESLRHMIEAIQFSRLHGLGQIAELHKLRQAGNLQELARLEKVTTLSRSAFAIGVLKDVGKNVGQSIFMDQVVSVVIDKCMENLKPIIKKEVIAKINNHSTLKQKLVSNSKDSIMQAAEKILQGNEGWQIFDGIIRGISKHLIGGSWKTKAVILTFENIEEITKISIYAERFCSNLADELKEQQKNSNSEIDLTIDLLSETIVSYIYSQATSLVMKNVVAIPMLAYQAHQENKAKRAGIAREQELQAEYDSAENERDRIDRAKGQDPMAYQKEIESMTPDKPANEQTLRTIASKEKIIIQVEQYEMQPVDWSELGIPEAQFDIKKDVFAESIGPDTQVIRLVKSDNHYMLHMGQGNKDGMVIDELIKNNHQGKPDQACLIKAVLFQKKYNELMGQGHTDPRIAAIKYACDSVNIKNYYGEMRNYAIKNPLLRIQYNSQRVKARHDLFGGGRSGEQKMKREKPKPSPGFIIVKETGNHNVSIKEDKKLLTSEYAYSDCKCDCNFYSENGQDYWFEIQEVNKGSSRNSMSDVIWEQFEIMQKELPEGSFIKGVKAKNVMDETCKENGIRDLLRQRKDKEELKKYSNMGAIPKIMLKLCDKIDSNANFTMYLKDEDNFYYEFKNSISVKPTHQGHTEKTMVVTEMYFWLDYSPIGLNHLLQLRLESIQPLVFSVKKSKNLQSIKIQPNDHNSFKRQFYSLFEEIRYIYNEKKIQFILIPALIQQSYYTHHWVGLVLNKRAYRIDINYLDSENQPIDEKFKKEFTCKLQEIYHDYEINYFQVKLETQKYNNCGSELIENFIYYLTNTRATQEAAVYLHSLLYENSLLDPSTSWLQIQQNNKIIDLLSQRMSVDEIVYSEDLQSISKNLLFSKQQDNGLESGYSEDLDIPEELGLTIKQKMKLCTS